MSETTHKSLAGAGLLAALASSLCCVVPAVAALASISGIASSFAWIEPARPYLLVLTIVTLGAAWYMQLRPAKEITGGENAIDDCGCEVKPFYATKTFLIIISLFAVAMMTFPSYAHIFYADNGQQAVVVAADQEDNRKEAKIKIKGMTCGGCEAHVESALKKQAGVFEASASYKDGEATVLYDQTKITWADLSQAIEKETGYTVIENKK